MPKIQMRQDSASNWKTVNPVLLSGEWALETDTKKMKIGDGSTAYHALPYFREEDNQWEKPQDWFDIRSGALSNSIYFLVGHSADYATYPVFAVNATVSNSGTYDVFVDGLKQATTASGTTTTLTWQTLALESGFDTTYPVALRTHIVRVTPTVDTNTISAIKMEGSGNAQSTATLFGTLWVHFNISTPITLTNFAGATSSKYAKSLILEAITSSSDSLKIATGDDNLKYAFGHLESLKTLPVLEGDGVNSNGTVGYVFNKCSSLKKITLKNIVQGTGDAGYMFNECFALEEIETINSPIRKSYRQFYNCNNLKHAPTFQNGDANNVITQQFTACDSLQDTYLDYSANDNVTTVSLAATSSHPVRGIKGVVVSNEAPFNGTGSQIHVAYTGLSRAALVNLFKSMPYNVGYEVVGSPTIVEGVVSGFANNQGISVPALSATGGKPFEMQISFTANSTTANALNILYTPSARVRFGVYSSNRPAFKFQNTGTTANTQVAFDTVISMNTKYTAKAVYDGTTVTCTLYNSSGTLIETKTSTGNYELYWPNGYYGYLDSAYWDGSIDLNETYIKINGIPWFRGTAAMTKTCSVVGCSGTADLTADDKAICTGKGWELTVE